eukprot:Sdes_comp10171_c0_seq1m1785
MSLMEDSQISVVSLVGENRGRCGYCSGPSSSVSFYLHSHRLTPTLYQEMMERGWRRCGQLLYKPNMENTCCPQYPIRLDPDKLCPSRTQRKTLKRFKQAALQRKGSDSLLANHSQFVYH